MLGIYLIIFNYVHYISRPFFQYKCRLYTTYQYKRAYYTNTRCRYLYIVQIISTNNTIYDVYVLAYAASRVFIYIYIYIYHTQHMIPYILFGKHKHTIKLTHRKRSFHYYIYMCGSQSVFGFSFGQSVGCVCIFEFGKKNNVKLVVNILICIFCSHIYTHTCNSVLYSPWWLCCLNLTTPSQSNIWWISVMIINIVIWWIRA